MDLWTWAAVVMIGASVLVNVLGLRTDATRESRTLWAVLGMLALAIVFAANR